MKRLLLALIPALLCSLIALGQDKPAAPTPPPPPTPPVTATICGGQSPCDELGRTKVLAAYQKALISQSAIAQAQAEFQRAAADYQSLSVSVAAAEKQPQGMVYNVNVGTGVVVAQPATPTTTIGTPSPSVPPAVTPPTQKSADKPPKK